MKPWYPSFYEYLLRKPFDRRTTLHPFANNVGPRACYSSLLLIGLESCATMKRKKQPFLKPIDYDITFKSFICSDLCLYTLFSAFLQIQFRFRPRTINILCGLYVHSSPTFLVFTYFPMSTS